MDARFCAVCNKVSRASAPRGAIGSATLAEILQFLNDEQIRATYRAVGEVLGVIPRSLGARLGPHGIDASWIVSGETGLPTGYSADETHPGLHRTDEIISSGTALLMRMAAWKAR
jgi:hypothetical protein